MSNDKHRRSSMEVFDLEDDVHGPGSTAAEPDESPAGRLAAAIADDCTTCDGGRRERIDRLRAVIDGFVEQKSAATLRVAGQVEALERRVADLEKQRASTECKADLARNDIAAFAGSLTRSRWLGVNALLRPGRQDSGVMADIAEQLINRIETIEKRHECLEPATAPRTDPTPVQQEIGRASLHGLAVGILAGAVLGAIVGAGVVFWVG